MTITLQFGRQVPAESLRAWGARAIYSYSGYGRASVDLLWDRQSYSTEYKPEDDAAKTRFTDWVDEQTRDGGIARWCEGERLLPSEDRVISTRHASYVLEVCPNASHGYLYICAYELPPNRAPRPRAQPFRATPTQPSP